MGLLHITNSEDTATIEIMGRIGESFFTGGNTLESVKNEIDNISSPKINVKIASLGGDVFEGLAIHDFLQATKKDITTEIIGATASAGTVIAMAGKEVSISKNSLFLVHNSSTMAFGNARELKKTVSDLETVDRRLLSIYKNKTGKSTKEITDLLEQDKWIDANEAKDFGFIDKINKPTKIAAEVYESINNAKNLPNIKIKSKSNIMDENSKNWFQSQFDKLKPKEVDNSKELEGLKAKIEAQKNEIEDLNKAVADAKANKIEAAADLNTTDDENKPNLEDTTFNAIRNLVNKATH